MKRQLRAEVGLPDSVLDQVRADDRAWRNGPPTTESGIEDAVVRTKLQAIAIVARRELKRRGLKPTPQLLSLERWLAKARKDAE